MIQTVEPRSHVGDEFALQVTVTGADGQPQPVTGAIVDAAARLLSTIREAESVSVLDGPAGQLLIGFGKRLDVPGTWRVQVRVTLDGNPQTVVDAEHLVDVSVIP